MKNAFDDAAAGECGNLGFVKIERGKYSSDITNLSPADGNVGQTEKFMEVEYGCVPLREKKDAPRGLAERYAGKSGILDIECRDLPEKLGSRLKVPDRGHEEKVLEALESMGENKSRACPREASLIYGSSKVPELEKGLPGDICRVPADWGEGPGTLCHRRPEDRYLRPPRRGAVLRG